MMRSSLRTAKALASSWCMKRSRWFAWVRPHLPMMTLFTSLFMNRTRKDSTTVDNTMQKIDKAYHGHGVCPIRLMMVENTNGVPPTRTMPRSIRIFWNTLMFRLLFRLSTALGWIWFDRNVCQRIEPYRQMMMLTGMTKARTINVKEVWKTLLVITHRRDSISYWKATGEMSHAHMRTKLYIQPARINEALVR